MPEFRLNQSSIPHNLSSQTNLAVWTYRKKNLEKYKSRLVDGFL